MIETLQYLKDPNLCKFMHGIFLIRGNAGCISSTEGLEGLGLLSLLGLIGLRIHRTAAAVMFRVQGLGL